MGLEPFLLVEYLAPRWKKLSQSLIGSVAICMVALVVSLILVFFSVTDGLERMWIEKLTALSSPIRIVPKPAYYDSYYYQIDALSSEAGFQQKSLREKLLTDHAVQYNELLDEELPDNFPTPLLNKEGKPRDLVKELADYARKAGGYESFFTVYEVAPVSFEIQINRTKEDSNALPQNNVFSQHGLITSFSEERLKKLLIPTRVDNENKMTELAERLQLFQTQFPSRAPVFLPKGYQEAGFAIGDLGEIFYDVPTLTITQTMHAPFVIAGFYDPGLLAIGVRFLLAPSDVVTSIISQMHADDVVDMSGFHLYIPDYHEALAVKETLQKSLESNGLSPYFTVESYHDYSYAKDFLKELKSQKNLFSLIALLIIAVACSNIVTMLVLLVNDKRKEIAILRSLGASTRQIATLFALAGVIIGLLGFLLGTLIAWVTMAYVGDILQLIGHFQGFDAFDMLLHGADLPSTISSEALSFVGLATLLIALIAGLVPAVRASLLNPSELLKSA